MNAPGLGAAWVLTRDMYEPKYRAFMDDISGDLHLTEPRRPAVVWRAALAALSQRKGG